MNVILSIRPNFCKMIFSGQKKYEYRKRVFTRSDVDKVYIYATKPICRIVGYFTIDTAINDSPSTIQQIIFTNHDLLTDIMPFSNGGYYNYSGLLYNAGQTTGVSIHNSQFIIHNEAGAWYDLQGRKLAGRPTQKGVYINKGKKQVIISR